MMPGRTLWTQLAVLFRQSANPRLCVPRSYSVERRKDRGTPAPGAGASGLPSAGPVYSAGTAGPRTPGSSVSATCVLARRRSSSGYDGGKGMAIYDYPFLAGLERLDLAPHPPRTRRIARRSAFTSGKTWPYQIWRRVQLEYA